MRTIRSARPQLRKPALGVEALEHRYVLDTGLSSSLILRDQINLKDLIVTRPDDSLVIIRPPINIGDLLLRQVPSLSSRPGAPATLFLNFNGDSRTTWKNIEKGVVRTYPTQTIAPFDTDGDTNTLTDTEKQQITEIWARVAEDFAPFNINVTTDDPGNLTNGRTLMVNIGDSNGWYGTNNSGISSIGSFTDDMPNIVYAFTENMSGKGDAEFVNRAADTASHEAGHGFGLFHHQVLNSNFSVKDEYDPGTATWTPIMGDNLDGDRHTWSLGAYSIAWTDGTFTLGLQNDLFKLASRTNGFGLRPDEAGDTLAQARRLTFGFGGQATVHGVVGLHGKFYDDDQDYPSLSTDTDVYSFATTGGNVAVRADALGYANGANLRVRVELWDANRMIAAADAGSGTTATLNATVAGGQYYVKVLSGGGMVDIGQYTLTVGKPDLVVLSKFDRLTQVIKIRDLVNGLVAPEAVWDIAAQDAPADAGPQDLGPPPDAVWRDRFGKVRGADAPVPLPTRPVAEAVASLLKKKGQFILRLTDKVTGQLLLTRFFRGKVQMSRVDLDGDGQLDVLVLCKVGKRTQRLGFSGLDGSSLPA